MTTSRLEFDCSGKLGFEGAAAVRTDQVEEDSDLSTVCSGCVDQPSVDVWFLVSLETLPGRQHTEGLSSAAAAAAATDQ